MSYEGVPNKKRKVYADPDGDLYPLGFKLGEEDRSLIAASGTLDPQGVVMITGTHFKAMSIIDATYKAESAGTLPIAAFGHDGSADFRGDASVDFFYVVFNLNRGE